MEKRAIKHPSNALLPREGFAPERLLAPEQAVAAFLSRVPIAPPAREFVPLEAAIGRVLAETITAGEEYPNAPRSAMDGFAIAAAAAPGTFEIAYDVRMGALPAFVLAPLQAARIPTGGAVPAGADAVVPVEDTSFDESAVRIDRAVEAGDNVIPCGADMRPGDAVITARTRLAPRHAGVLATLGVTRVPVFGRPSIAVMSTGDELVAPSERPAPGQVRDSNRYAVAATLRAMGAEVRHFPTLGDEEGEALRALESALAACDAVVLTGGSSVGERDRLPEAVAALGDPGIVVHGLRVKPGKPLLLGALGAKPILALPGNPASAVMMLEAVCAPIVAALTGAGVAIRTLEARLDAPVRSRPGWTWYLPVTVRDEGGAIVAHPLPLQSFSVSLTARADGYVVAGEGDEEWQQGRTVTVRCFLGGSFTS